VAVSCFGSITSQSDSLSFKDAYGSEREALDKHRYSMGIRQKLASEFGSKPNKAGKLGRQATQDVLVLAERTPDYRLDLSKSRFCGVFPGDGWSGRLEDSVLHGCIPVIIQAPALLANFT